MGLAAALGAACTKHEPAAQATPPPIATPGPDIPDEVEWSAAPAPSPRVLLAPETFRGVRLPAGTSVSEFGDYPVVTTRVPIVVHGIPLIGQIYIHGDWVLDAARLAHNTTVQSWPCTTRDYLHFDEGKLTRCTLARPTVVGGVPCTDFTSVDDGVRCTLSGQYRLFGVTLGAGTKYYGPTVSRSSIPEFPAFAQIGPHPPSVRVLGIPPSAGKSLFWGPGALQAEFKAGFGPIYADCSLRMVEQKDGLTTGHGVSVRGAPCTVTLPEDAVKR